MGISQNRSLLLILMFAAESLGFDQNSLHIYEVFSGGTADVWAVLRVYKTRYAFAGGWNTPRIFTYFGSRC